MRAKRGGKFPQYRPNPEGEGAAYALLRWGEEGRGNQSAAEYDLEGYVTRQMDFYSRSGRTDHTFPHYHEMVWAPNARNDRGGSPKEILGKESPEP